MVVCLKHGGIQWRHLPVGQRMLGLHVLVIRLALWPCECWPVWRSNSHQPWRAWSHSHPEQLMLSCMLQCCLSRSEHRSYFAHLVSWCHCNSLLALPHPTSIGAGVVRSTLHLFEQLLNSCPAGDEWGMTQPQELFPHRSQSQLSRWDASHLPVQEFKLNVWTPLLVFWLATSHGSCRL
jgi:hypothetical protein